MGRKLSRERFGYRLIIYIGPVDYVPTFGQAIVRIVGVLVRAGYDVKLEIRQGAAWKSPD